ncbi:hypothetical protein ACFLSJ_04335 [Verrucomicrobiota bacterium]
MIANALVHFAGDAGHARNHVHNAVFVKHDLARQTDFIAQAPRSGYQHGDPEALPLFRTQKQSFVVFFMPMACVGAILNIFFGMFRAAFLPACAARGACGMVMPGMLCGFRPFMFVMGVALVVRMLMLGSDHGRHAQSAHQRNP